MKQKLGRGLALAAVAFFLIAAEFDFLSYFELSQPGYVSLGILLAAATLWITEAVPLFVTSLMVLFLCLVWLVPVMQQDGMSVNNQVFLSPFFSDIVLLFLGGFVLSAALHKQRVDEWLARSIMQRTGTSIPRLMLSVMLVTAFLSMWLSNTAAAAMMLALTIPIANRLPNQDPARKGLVLSIPFGANIGGLGTPIGSPPNAIAMQYMERIGEAPGFGTWMALGVPGVIVMTLLAWGTLLLLFRPLTQSLQVEKDSIDLPTSVPLNILLVTLAITVFGWVTSQWHGLTAGTIALIPVLVFFSTGLLNRQDLRSLSWDVLLLMGGGLCLGTAISESGLASWLIDLLPVDGIPDYWLMVVFGSVACLMSSVMSNTATANLILPILLGLSVESYTPLMLGTAFACSLAMPLPVSTPPNAMAFSTEQISVSDMVRPGLILTLVGVVLAFTTGYWWWGLLGI